MNLHVKHQTEQETEKFKKKKKTNGRKFLKQDLKQSTKQEKSSQKRNRNTKAYNKYTKGKHEAVGIENKKRHYASEQETSRQDNFKVLYAIIRFLT